MIVRENIIETEGYDIENLISNCEVKCKPEDIIFFDLEHYVYKKPKCIGVFGACIYNNSDKKLYVTQYMIENKGEVVDILLLAKKYFKKMKKIKKSVIVTFSGNNDFTVIKYLFQKFNIYFDFDKEFKSIDIQKEYEKQMNTSIGLKNLEKIFNIYREGDVISGSNLAKTFHKVLKDREYIERMPKEKIESILVYNEQDVVNLFNILINWKKYINNNNEDEINDIDNLNNENSSIINNSYNDNEENLEEEKDNLESDNDNLQINNDEDEQKMLEEQTLTTE